MKVRSAVRRLCRDCYVIKKKRVVYIRCKTVKKHKQRQGFHTEAGVLALEGGGHPHGLGDLREGYGSSSWNASSAAPSAKSPAEILAALPWLPSWASPPSSYSSSSRSSSGTAALWPASPVLKSGSGVPAAVERPSESLSVVAGSFSPLRVVGAWGAAFFGGARGTFWS